MKLNKFLLSAIAAASLTACSDSTDVVENNKGHWNADGTGYVSLSISMPDNVTSKGGRSSNNDDFDYGNDKEYAVKKALLIIFTSTNDRATEDQYTCEAAYDLTTNFIKEDNGQIGATSKVTQEINHIDDNKIAKALVILNAPDDFTANANDKLSISGSEFTGSFADFKGKTATLSTNLADGFTMTNAPLTTAFSSALSLTTGSSSTLANIDKTKIAPTIEQASTQPASTIYVERSVAKVTVNNSIKDNTNNIVQTVELPENKDFNITIKGYALNNTNKESYLVRNVDDSWNTYVSQASSVSSYADKYRFVGYQHPVTFNNGNYYRTYWAKDLNYDNTATGLNSALPTTWENNFDGNTPLYCLENTFDVANQTHRNTTRVIVQAEIKAKSNTGNAETLYMWNDDANTLASESAFNTASGSAVAIANKLYDVVATSKTIKEIEHSNSNQGYVEVTKIIFTDNTEATSGEAFKAVHDYFGKIAKYEGGKVYYSVLIKHFGDSLTPWNDGEWGDDDNNKPQSGDVANIYPSANRDNNYLGRYGVVRNNWYNINLNKINKIGTPDIDYDKDTPDDELNSYISVSINILSWAKRSQDVDLQ